MCAVKLFLLLTLLLPSTLLAEVPAVPDSTSPDGKVMIKNIGDSSAPFHHFQIVSSTGEVLLSSGKHPTLMPGYFAEDIIWSPDGSYVAFSVLTSGPYVHDTFVYVVNTRQLHVLPTDDPDHQTRPIRWHNKQTLIIETSGSWGGKATKESTDAFYKYRRTIRLSGKPLHLDTLYISPVTYLYRERN